MKCKDCKKFNRVGSVLGYCKELDKLTNANEMCELEKGRIILGLDFIIVILAFIILSVTYGIH